MSEKLRRRIINVKVIDEVNLGKLLKKKKTGRRLEEGK